MTSFIESWLHRRRVKTEVLRSGRHVEQRRVTNPYHAVTVVPGLECCQAARVLQGHRFLSTEAPALPLKGCDRSSCGCRYNHHNDRRARAGDRRRQDVWNVQAAGRVKNERRAAAGGRRSTDH